MSHLNIADNCIEIALMITQVPILSHLSIWGHARWGGGGGGFTEVQRGRRWGGGGMECQQHKRSISRSKGIHHVVIHPTDQ